MGEYWWVFAILIIAGALVFTKPSDDLIIKEVEQAAASVFDGARVAGNSQLEKGFNKVTCSVARAECARQVKNEYKTSIDDFVLIKIIDVKFRSATIAKCFGAANSVLCPG